MEMERTHTHSTLIAKIDSAKSRWMGTKEKGFTVIIIIISQMKEASVAFMLLLRWYVCFNCIIPAQRALLLYGREREEKGWEKRENGSFWCPIRIYPIVHWTENVYVWAIRYAYAYHRPNKDLKLIH